MKTLLVLLLVFATEDSPSKQSAIAPSLKALSKEEEAKIEEIIERFVRADTGRLKGAEAKQALKDFEALPPEAIPALIRALNKAAKDNQTCPVLMITKKLSKMLTSSDDDQLLEFAKDELGADGADRSRYAGALKDLKYKIQTRRQLIARSPKPKPVEQPKALSRQSTAELAKLASTERGEKLEGVVAELGKRDGKEALEGLVVVAGSTSDVKARKLAREALESHLGRLSATALAPRLEDESDEVRRIAVRLAAKHAKLVPKVIERIDDDSPEVRAEARAALKALSKGEDFGPSPSASPEQRREAKKKWQAWFDKRK